MILEKSLEPGKYLFHINGPFFGHSPFFGTDVQKNYFFKIYWIYLFSIRENKIYLFINEVYFQVIDLKWIHRTLNLVKRLFNSAIKDFPWLWKIFSQCISNHLCSCLIPIIWLIWIKITKCLMVKYFFSRFEYNYCIYFQVTKNTIYLFSEKIIRICIFENGWVWVNSFEIGACWVPSKLSIDFLDPIIPVFAPKFSRQTMLSDDGHFKLIPRDWNKFEKAY